jgi:hypothetical protein
MAARAVSAIAAVTPAIPVVGMEQAISATAEQPHGMHDAAQQHWPAARAFFMNEPTGCQA